MSSNVTPAIQDELSAQSVLEYNFLRYILARAALPEIADFTVPQFPVNIEDRIYRIDYGIVGTKHKFAIELDGFVAHSQKDNFNKDRFRGNDLINDGWTLIRFSTENVNNDPKRCIAQLQDTLARDPFLKNYLLQEIVSELPKFSNNDWEQISQVRKNGPNKGPSAARLNRDNSFRNLKTEGTATLTLRKKLYLDWLKDPSNSAAYQSLISSTPAQSNNNQRGSFNIPSTGNGFQKSNSVNNWNSNPKRNQNGLGRPGVDALRVRNNQSGRKKIPAMALIVSGLVAVTICVLVLGFVLFPMLSGQPTPTGPQVNQPTAAPSNGNTTPGISLVDELRAQPCRVGQIKGSTAKTYYLPGQKLYADTKENVTCFNSEAEAQAGGFSKANT